MNIYNLNKFSYNSKFLRNSLNSINSLKKLLLVGNNNTFSYKITPKRKRICHNYKTNILTYNKFKNFYTNSLNYVRPTYLRSFSKVNKRKVFITFKNSNLDSTFNPFYQNTDNSYLLYIIFTLQSFPSVHSICSYTNNVSGLYLTNKTLQFDKDEMSRYIKGNPIYSVSTTLFDINYFSKSIFNSFKHLHAPYVDSFILKNIQHNPLKYNTPDESVI